ncbi:MAG: hypothetical protein R3D02_00255 [Hyphomicrobiales bacterium]
MTSRIYRPVGNDGGLPGAVVAREVHFGDDGLRIAVVADGAQDGIVETVVEISFSSNPFLFRMLDEGDYLSTPGVVPFWFCVVENSEYLNWFNEETQGVRENQGITHFAIYTATICFDILHNEMPAVSIR